MSEIETLIRREFHWLSDGSLDDPDLASRIIRASRRRRIRKVSFLGLFTIAVSTLSIFGYVTITNMTSNKSDNLAIVTQSSDG